MRFRPNVLPPKSGTNASEEPSSARRLEFQRISDVGLHGSGREAREQRQPGSVPIDQWLRMLGQELTIGVSRSVSHLDLALGARNGELWIPQPTWLNDQLSPDWSRNSLHRVGCDIKQFPQPRCGFVDTLSR